MSDLIAIEPGREPWAPAGDAELGDVFHSFTVPLVGTIRQGGHEFLFWCVSGHAAPANAWAYCRPGGDLIEALRNADDATFDSALQAAAQENTVFAMASDDSISVSVHLDPPADFDDVYDRGLEALQERLNETSEELAELQRRIPKLPAQLGRPSPRQRAGQS